MPCPFVFPKKKKKEGREKLIKSRFSKVMHLSLKLGAFGYALSPLSRTSKNNSPLFKKKKKKKGEKFFSKMKGYHA